MHIVETRNLVFTASIILPNNTPPEQRTIPLGALFLFAFSGFRTIQKRLLDRADALGQRRMVI